MGPFSKWLNRLEPIRSPVRLKKRSKGRRFAAPGLKNSPANIRGEHGDRSCRRGLIDVVDVEVVYDDVRSRTMLRITNRRNGMTTVAIVELTRKQTVELLAALIA